MFWNLENFFDWKRDLVLDNPSEAEFTSFGKKHWTRKKFFRKCENVSKAVFWIADRNGGRLPDLVGVAEVENRRVLKMLLEETGLRHGGYGIVHFDSPDPRGIDVALLYRKDRIGIVSAKPLRVEGRTRDILLAEALIPGGDTLGILINHHPSKYGGKSSGRRKAAMGRLIGATDSLLRCGRTGIMAMGDFNDTPPATEEYSRIMVNLAVPLERKGEGTIKYSGKWEMIDMFFVSPELFGRGVEMKVLRIPFLMSRDNVHSGEKPLRTYSGPRYLGGVSDHCPIMMVIPLQPGQGGM